MTDDNPLEAHIERQVCLYARREGFYECKFTAPGRRSVPDRFLINRKGHPFFIEFKRRGEKPTPAQYREHDRLRKHGQHVYVIDNIALGKRLIDRLAFVHRNAVMEIDLEALARLPETGD